MWVRVCVQVLFLTVVARQKFVHPPNSAWRIKICIVSWVENKNNLSLKKNALWCAPFVVRYLNPSSIGGNRLEWRSLRGSIDKFLIPHFDTFPRAYCTPGMGSECGDKLISSFHFNFVCPLVWQTPKIYIFPISFIHCRSCESRTEIKLPWNHFETVSKGSGIIHTPSLAIKYTPRWPTDSNLTNR